MTLAELRAELDWLENILSELEADQKYIEGRITEQKNNQRELRQELSRRIKTDIMRDIASMIERPGGDG